MRRAVKAAHVLAIGLVLAATSACEEFPFLCNFRTKYVDTRAVPPSELQRLRDEGWLCRVQSYVAADGAAIYKCTRC